MNRLLTLVVLSLGLMLPGMAQAQPPWDDPGPYGPPPPRYAVPNLAGTWYANGDPNRVCEIDRPRPDGRLLFTNDAGSAAWGTIRGNTVWIPDWTDGVSQGLLGVLRRGRIVWPNGTYWSRSPE